MNATAADMVATLDASLDAVERGRLDELASTEILHPEIEWTSAIGSVLGGGSYRGREGAGEWLGDLSGTSQRLRWRDRDWRVLGDELILLLARFEMQGKASGAAVENELGAVFELTDGLIRRVTTYHSHAEALAAAETISA